MQLTIVSGRSGSGKSITLRALEDLGYTCIDNCPIILLKDLITHQEQDPSPTAISLDARNFPQDSTTVTQVVDALRTHHDVHIIYLDAQDDVLIKRFGETRRRHPLSGPEVTLLEAIQLESGLLSPLAEAADTFFDTTDCTVSQINGRINECFSKKDAAGPTLLLMSFGYKHGKPADADLVFDARCLPNPYWVPELREFSGKDPQVQAYLKQKSNVQQFISDIDTYIEKWIEHFISENRCYLTVAVGCTGGQHRSVYVVEQLYALIQSRYPGVQCRHRHMTPSIMKKEK